MKILIYLLCRHNYITEKSPGAALARTRSEPEPSFWSWTGEEPESAPVFVVENWTKWTLTLRHVQDQSVTTVKPQTYAKVDIKVRNT